MTVRERMLPVKSVVGYHRLCLVDLEKKSVRNRMVVLCVPFESINANVVG